MLTKNLAFMARILIMPVLFVVATATTAKQVLKQGTNSKYWQHNIEESAYKNDISQTLLMPNTNGDC